MLVFDRVTKFYRTNGIKKIIFSDFSFSFPVDRNIGVMGKNGAGKSTMMRLMAGVEPPNKGHVYRTLRVSWPLGFGGGFNGSMTGLENIKFVSRIYGQDPKKIIAYVEEFSELGESLRTPIKSYSSGMKARLAFGLSMAIDFDTYLIDEVTAVGDENFKIKSKDAFENKLKRSRVIMISHSKETISSYCDCGLLLEEGKITFFNKVEDLIKEYSNINSK